MFSDTDVTEQLQLVKMVAAEHSHVTAPLIPIAEVAFGYGKWWSLPKDMSEALYVKMCEGQNGGYTLDSGKGGRARSWREGLRHTNLHQLLRDRPRSRRQTLIMTASDQSALFGYPLRVSPRATQAKESDVWCYHRARKKEIVRPK